MKSLCLVSLLATLLAAQTDSPASNVSVPAELKAQYFQARMLLEHSVGRMSVYCAKQQGRELAVIKNAAGDEEDLLCHAPQSPPKEKEK